MRVGGRRSGKGRAWKDSMDVSRATAYDQLVLTDITTARDCLNV